MPDGNFDGVEVLWIGLVLLAALVAGVARRRSAGAEPRNLVENPSMAEGWDWPRSETEPAQLVLSRSTGTWLRDPGGPGCPR